MAPPKRYKHDIPDKKSALPQQIAQPHSELNMDKMIAQDGGKPATKKTTVPNTGPRKK